MFLSNTRLCEHLVDYDYLNIKNSLGFQRRATVSYYINGHHHKLCQNENCYSPKQESQCRFCGQSTDNYRHLLSQCTFESQKLPRERVKLLLSQT